ncbi:MAG: hypothetical protein Q9179_001451 [Wetmoreana sp. 5 TL-2023]
MVGTVRNLQYDTSSSGAIYLLIGFIEVVVVLLCFIGTLMYASVIYHRHRRNIPYHRSEQKDAVDSDHYKGPLTGPKMSTTNYSGPSPNRDSCSAPEVGGEDSVRRKNEKSMGELDNDNEIREMDGKYSIGDEKGGARRDGKPRELEGDPWLYELSATRSIKSSRRAMTEFGGERARE